MALILRPQAQHWVAAIHVKGKLTRLPLTYLQDEIEVPIPIEGKRPSSLKRLDEGDEVFTESYHTALAAHKRLVQELKSKATAKVLSERLRKAGIGNNTKEEKIENLPTRWRQIPRKRTPGDDYLKQGGAVLGRFVEYMNTLSPDLRDVDDITAEHLQGFLHQENERGISARSWNASLKFLRSAFKHVAPGSEAFTMYLRDIPLKDEDTVHRKPFKDNELQSIIRAVIEDEMLRGPVITSICTGMRKGDCCTLSWESVDLEENFIVVKTSKTKETCEIPILPLLREELTRLQPSATGSDVFPEAAVLYRNPRNRHKLDTRFKQMMRKAGFAQAPDKPKKKSIKERPDLKQVDDESLMEKAEHAMSINQYQQRKTNVMRQVLALYLSGKSLPQISQDLNVSKGTVSLHLNTLEEITGCVVLRRKQQTGELGTLVEDSNDQRLKRGSVIGWHSFRTSFVTGALSAGMPEELVRRVTGHQTVDLMREHYLRPDREDFKREFERVASKLLLSGTPSESSQSQRDEAQKNTSIAMGVQEVIDEIKPMSQKELGQNKKDILQKLEALLGDEK
jgi:integrase